LLANISMNRAVCCQLDTGAFINEIMAVYLKRSEWFSWRRDIYGNTVFNATFNNISIISWRSDLLVEETVENNLPATSAERHIWEYMWAIQTHSKHNYVKCRGTIVHSYLKTPWLIPLIYDVIHLLHEKCNDIIHHILYLAHA
jgi:hypothetical protein